MIRSRPVADALRFLWPRAADPTRRDAGLVAKIQQLAASYKDDAGSVITQRASELRKSVQQGADTTSPEVLLPGFALVTEAVRRVLGIWYYDVQLLAGLALSRRAIAEMKTGEGKTLVAALPAFTGALAGKGVHVMTVNAYLAERDFELLRPVYKLLDMSVGMLDPESSHDEQRAAYHCDITYGPGYEFGFDYLRDQAAQWARKKPRLGETYRRAAQGQMPPAIVPVQRGFALAIVDEVDSVLIDEATTPLLLAEAPAETAPNAQAFVIARRAAERLIPDHDFVIKPTDHSLHLTQLGLQEITADGQQAAPHGLQRPWHIYVEQALRARLLLERDVDYIVSDGKVLLVDQYTGRVFADRSLRDGLHQAVQAKEGVTITAEAQSVAHISRQRFFRLYDAICGMTGTATDAARELWEVYRLPVVTIPLRRPCCRRTLAVRYFADAASKYRAIVDEILRIHTTGQPILVGTRSIEGSEALAEQLAAHNIPFQLLNGKQDAEEASIVAQAGCVGTITIATNMAGRGTDIKLGPGAAERGGLHVIAAERHESARVDRQLIGRAARQGDPGSCQFFVAADDHLLARYAPSLAARICQLAGDDGEAHHDFSREVARAQRKAERAQLLRRRQLFAHDDWLEDVLSRLAKET
jgi:preprotein translocase subunit SecA